MDLVPVCSRTRFQIKKGVLSVPSYNTRFLDLFSQILISVLRNRPTLHHLVLSNRFILNVSIQKSEVISQNIDLK